MRMPKNRRTRELIKEGYWPTLDSADYQPDRGEPIGFGVHYIAQDRIDWYHNVSGQTHDTREEAQAYVIRQIEHYANQGACITWAIKPIYPMTSEEREAFAEKYLRSRRAS